MDQAEFEALVQRMERLAGTAPAAYRSLVVALAAFGYALLLTLVLGLALLLVMLVAGFRHAPALALKLGFLAGALLLVVLRALWVRLEPPDGERLTREEAPEFFALLARLAARLDTPKVHTVLATPDFNAAVVQLPRLGVFGWHRNYLLVGLPLMQCLSAQQFEAVLAHELGHLSRGHARLGNWIYRLRQVWMRLDGALAKRPRWGSGAIRGVLHWYAPYFNACSFPLARRNEFEADACSAQLVSPGIAAQALTNVGVIGGYLHESYWPTVGAGARESAQPSFAPYSDMNATVLRRLDAEEAQRRLERALAEPTTYADTHPSLKDRLAALGAQAQLALAGAQTAAGELLGARGDALARAFDARWRDGVAASWKQVYEETQGRRARLAMLRDKAAAAALPTGESVELADLEEDVGAGAAAALALRRTLMQQQPDSPVVRFVLARQLLQQGGAEGVALMEEVVGAEREAILPGCELLRDYWWRQGQRELARQWHERARQRRGVLEESKREREQLKVGNLWLEHGLDADALAALVARLKEIPGLGRAYLVRKSVVHDPERPLYVLGFALARRAGAGARESVVNELRGNVPFPGETLIISVEGANSAFGRQFRQIWGARIL